MEVRRGTMGQMTVCTSAVYSYPAAGYEQLMLTTSSVTGSQGREACPESLCSTAVQVLQQQQSVLAEARTGMRGLSAVKKKLNPAAV